MANNTEARIVGDISKAELWKNISTLSQWERHAGTPDEKKAADYLRSTLEKHGLAVTVHEAEQLLGYPGAATLKVVAPERFEIKCITHGFGGRTNGREVEGQLDYVRTGTLEGKDLRGKVALDEGLAMGYMVNNAQQAGAVATIFIQDDRFRDICLSPVWGTPTTASAKTLPTIPCISILHDDGERLKALLSKGPVTVRLTAEPRLEWHTTPIVTGEIRGTQEPNRWVMVSCHYCAWYHGAVDNAAANSIVLEIARVLSAHRQDLRRGVRVFFWPGHSQGRFSGSTWYCDHFWEQIYQECVAHVNLDGMGAKGAGFYSGQGMVEGTAVMKEVIREVRGEDAEIRRSGRGGDQSFWGIGMPSLMVSGKVPTEMATQINRSLSATPGEAAPKAGPGTPWYWHNPADTLDKADADVMAQQAQMVALMVLRTASSPVLPFNYELAADQVQSTAASIQKQAGAAFDLAPVVDRARMLKTKVQKLNEAAQALGSGAGKDGRAGVANDCLMALGRQLVPILYTAAGPFEQDPANTMPILPGLAPAARLAHMPADGDQRRFLAAEVLRQRNRAEHALALSVEKVEDALRKLGQA